MNDLQFGFAVHFRDLVSKGVTKARAAVQSLWSAIKTLTSVQANSTAATKTFSAAQLGGYSATTKFAASLRIGGVRLGQWAQRARHSATATGVFTRAVQGLALFLSARFLAGAFMSVVSIGAEFEQTMVNVGSVLAGGTQEDIKRLTAEARRLGSTTAFTAREAADAMYVLATAGFSTNKIIDSTAATLNLAAIGEISLAESAELLVSTLTQFKLGTEEANRVTQAMIAGSLASTQSVSELGMAMRHAGSLSASLGMEIEDTVSILGVFGQAGYKGAQAGVAFKNMTSSLMKESKNLGNALDFLGLKMEDVNPKTNSFTDIMDRLQPLAQNMNLTFKLFGQRTAPQFLALMAQGSQVVKDMRLQMSQVATATAIYELRMSTLSGAMKITSSAVEDLQLTLFDIIKPAVLDRVQSFGTTILVVQRTIERIRPVLDVFIKLVIRLFHMAGDAVTSALAKMMPSVANLASTAQMTRQSIEEAIGPMVLYASVMSIRIQRFFKGIIEGMSGAFKVVAAVGGPIIAVLAPIADKLMGLFGIIGEGGDKYNGLGRAIGFVLTSIAIFKVSRFLLAIPASVIQSALSYTTAILGVARTSVTTTATVAVSLARWVTGSAALAAATGYLSTAFLFLRGAVFRFLAGAALAAAPISLVGVLIGLVVAAVAGLIYYFREELWQSAQPAIDGVKTLWNNLVTIMQPAAEFFKQVFLANLQIVVDLVRIQVANIRIIFASLVIAGKAIFGFFRDTVIPIFQGIWDNIKAGWAVVGEFTSDIFRKITGVVKIALTKLMDMWTAVRNFMIRIPFLQPIVRAIEIGVGALKAAFKSFIDFVAGLKIPDWILALTDWLKNAIGNVATNREKLAEQLEIKAGLRTAQTTKPATTATQTSGIETLATNSLDRPNLSAFSDVTETEATQTIAKATSSVAQPAKTTQFSMTFNDGSIRIEGAGIKDPDELARTLMPALQRLAREQEERGAP